MAMNSIGIQYRRIILLLLPLLLMMQLVNGEVVINNTSTFAVSVYDTNTTELIDPLPANAFTKFNLGSPGPDFFVITQFSASGATVGSCTVKVIDNEILFLYDGSNMYLLYTIISPNPPGVADSPTSHPQLRSGARKHCV